MTGINKETPTQLSFQIELSCFPNRDFQRTRPRPPIPIHHKNGVMADT